MYNSCRPPRYPSLALGGLTSASAPELETVHNCNRPPLLLLFLPYMSWCLLLALPLLAKSERRSLLGPEQGLCAAHHLHHTALFVAYPGWETGRPPVMPNELASDIPIISRVITLHLYDAASHSSFLLNWHLPSNRVSKTC